jgi:hypothetical protein
MVDGGFNMDSGSNNSQISNVGIDFIEEVNIKTANFSAEYGRNSGASINVITRGGSNKLRGSLFEYNRDESFDANDYFANARAVSKAPLSYNNFGWRLGGAIKRDKLFFSVGEEWKKIRRLSSANNRTLPTSAMRNGDFSAITTVIRDPLTGQPFPGNIIPPSRITADGRAFAKVYGDAAAKARAYTDTPTANNALFQDDFPFDWRQDQVRLDWQATQAQRLTVRVLLDDYVTGDPYGTFIGSQLPTVPTSRNRPGRNIQVNHSWSMQSNLINEFKANAAWNGQRIPPVGDAWKRETYGFTYPQLFTGGGTYENSIPDTTVSGYASFFGAARSLISPTTDIAFGDNLSWIKGRHTLKFGALVIRNRKDQNGRSTYTGNLAFNATGNPRTSGHSFADALLGNFRTYSEFASDPMGFFRFWQGEAFRVGQLARHAELQRRSRHALHLSQADQPAGQQHGQLRPLALRPGARGHGAPERHARAGLGQPAERHGARGRRRARGRARPRAQREQPAGAGSASRRAARPLRSPEPAGAALQLFLGTPGQEQHGDPRRLRPVLRPARGQPALRRNRERARQQPAVRRQRDVRERQSFGAGLVAASRLPRPSVPSPRSTPT